MHPTRFVLLTLVICSASLFGCNSPKNEPTRRTNDAGRVVAREECKIPNMNCYKGCFERGEQRHCPACCFDMLILCDEGNPYNFDSCATAEQEPTPRKLPLQK